MHMKKISNASVMLHHCPTVGYVEEITNLVGGQLFYVDYAARKRSYYPLKTDFLFDAETTPSRFCARGPRDKQRVY